MDNELDEKAQRAAEKAGNFAHGDEWLAVAIRAYLSAAKSEPVAVNDIMECAWAMARCSDVFQRQHLASDLQARIRSALVTAPPAAALDVAIEAQSIADMVADWYGSLALPKAHIPASIIENRLNRLATIKATQEAK